MKMPPSFDLSVAIGARVPYARRQPMEVRMAQWLPVIIGVVVAIALILGGALYVRSRKPN